MTSLGYFVVIISVEGIEFIVLPNKKQEGNIIFPSRLQL